MSNSVDLLQGTLDLLILRTLTPGPMHGWGISQRIQQVSEDVLKVNQGSLYPALHRLEEQGWIGSEWGASENGRRAKYYSLTKPWVSPTTLTAALAEAKRRDVDVERVVGGWADRPREDEEWGLERAIVGALRAAIKDHGPITPGE
jgi:transcriptional regulator